MKIKRFFFVWDVNEVRNNFGSLLIFLAEIEALTCQDSVVNICYISDISGDNNYSLFMSVMKFFSGTYNILFFSSAEEFREYKNCIGSNMLTSMPKHIDNSSYTESTIFLQDLYNSNKSSKRLTVPTHIKSRVNRWLIENCKNYKPIVVHLKNSPNNTESNASQKDWQIFFTYAKKYKVKFILIGNDKIDENILSLPNVIETKEHGGDTELDISLILSAYLFMGMSSGPCNVAIFSNIPYVIWKHPNHHVKEMNRELGSENTFSFSRKNQTFLREYDNSDFLISSFKNTYRAIDEFNNDK